MSCADDHTGTDRVELNGPERREFERQYRHALRGRIELEGLTFPTTATTLCVCGEGDFIGDSTPGPCYIDAAGFTVHRPTTATAEGSEG